MNDHDKENLKFLMTASAEVLEDWYHSVEEDDHLYAQELLDQYEEEINAKAAQEEQEAYEFEMEKKLMKMSFFPEVATVLSKCKYLH